MTKRDAAVIAIFGPPGAGKTTTAVAVAQALGAGYVSSGDVARRVDPSSLANGQMANRRLLADGFQAALTESRERWGRVVVDGLPRDPGDVDYLPADTMYILLNVDRDISIERQKLRGRPGDGNLEIVIKRTDEQRALMQLDDKEGWAYRLATWERGMQTNDKTRVAVIDRVLGYIDGSRKTVA